MILLNKLFSAKKSAKARVDYPLLLLGAVIYGVSVGLVLSPNEIAPGGASGLAVMLSRFLPLGVGSLTMAINLPLLAVSLYVFGWRFLLGTVVAIAVSGLTADMCTLFTPLTNDIFLSAIAGGILLGAGCGIVFRSGGTTGGTLGSLGSANKISTTPTTLSSAKGASISTLPNTGVAIPLEAIGAISLLGGLGIYKKRK